MRKLLLLVTLAMAALVPATAARAATVVQRDIPFTATVDACGETIHLSGTLVGVFTEQPLARGGFLVTFHFQPTGATGTSSSGAVYHATGLTRETTVAVPSGGLTDTFVNRFLIIGTGGAPSYTVIETLHVTVTPAGAIAVGVDHFRTGCR